MRVALSMMPCKTPLSGNHGANQITVPAGCAFPISLKASRKAENMPQ